MDEITTRDSNSLLAAFARAPEKMSEGAMVAMSAPAPMERVVGAQQVAVYRDEEKVLQKLKVLAAAAGQDWYYRYPAKRKEGGQDWIEGPSIKLANDLARLYGNCEVDTRVMDLGDSWLIYARFTDFETGFSMTRPYQQRKGQRGMRTDNDRALDIAFQIGTSKAIRNVVVNSLQTFADFAFDEARNALVQKIGKDVGAWRDRTMQGLANKKIDLARVEKVMGRSAKDWTAPDIARVIAMMQSIADGMTTIDEAFPPLGGHIESPGIEESASETSADEEAGAGVEVSRASAPASTRESEASPGPKTPEAYFEYAVATINRMREQDGGDRAAKEWFTSADQRKLRSSIGIEIDAVSAFFKRVLP